MSIERLPTPAQPDAECFELIHEIQLRNKCRVFTDGDDYLVEHLGRHGESYRQPVSARAVEWLRESFRGQTITSNDATQAFTRSEGLDLPYDGGHKLHFYAQSVLIVLVARGQATIREVGKVFEYTFAR